VTARPVPRRHWRSYGDDKLPTGAEALDEPFAAFPSWFLRIECDRCGKTQMLNEAHMPHRARLLRDIIAKMGHDGCGGRAAKVELITGIRGRQQPAGASDRAARGLTAKRPPCRDWGALGGGRYRHQTKGGRG
jgi:hypothetical protein